jgi:hypothetical protein
VSNINFSSVFQNRVTDSALTPVTLSELEGCQAAGFLAQFEVSASRVLSLLKDIIKTKQLWMPPVIVTVTSTGDKFIASGNHRVAAIVQLIQTYGIKPDGKITLLCSASGEMNENVTPFEGTILVREVAVPTPADAVLYLQSHNGSRSMATPEKLAGKIYSGNMSPAERAQSMFTKALHNALSPVNNCTVLTASIIAGRISKVVGKNAKFLSLEQMEEIAVDIAAILKELLEASDFPSNFAREGASFLVDAILVHQVDIEETGETVSYPEWVASIIEVPAKPEKAPRIPASGATAKLNKLMAALAANGIDVSAMMESDS